MGNRIGIRNGGNKSILGHERISEASPEKRFGGGRSPQAAELTKSAISIPSGKRLACNALKLVKRVPLSERTDCELDQPEGRSPRVCAQRTPRPGGKTNKGRQGKFTGRTKEGDT